jgi:NDP-sugar pyrophosphorylase family protein
MRALVLCAGRGTRLGALTASTPKPMLELAGGRTILEVILLQLAAGGVRDVVVNLHYLPDAIVSRIGSGDRLGVRVRYLREPVLLGTAGTARAASERFGRGPLLVHYGDVVTDHDLGSLVAHWRRTGEQAAILVHRRRGSNSEVYVDGAGRVTRFVERPARPSAGSPSCWVFSGIAVLSERRLEQLPAETPCDLPRDVLPGWAERGLLFAQPLDGYRCAVDSPARLEQAREAFARCGIGWAKAAAPFSGPGGGGARGHRTAGGGHLARARENGGP